MIITNKKYLRDLEKQLFFNNLRLYYVIISASPFSICESMILQIIRTRSWALFFCLFITLFTLFCLFLTKTPIVWSRILIWLEIKSRRAALLVFVCVGPVFPSSLFCFLSHI